MTARATGLPDRIAWWTWLALLVAIPVTSFPLVRSTIGGETVSPLSLLPLILLAPWIVRHLLRGGRLPIEAGPLLLFAGLAVTSSLLAFFSPMGPYKNQTVFTRSLDGLAALGVGLGFYLAASLIPDDRSKALHSVRAITVGAVLTLIWSTAQAWYVLFTRGYIPPPLNELHRLASTRDLFWDRVTGLAFEPSWFGNQLVLLYIPLWIGSIAVGRSAFGRGRRFLLIEAVLILWAVAMLLMARSRISVISLTLMTLALLSYGLWWGSSVVLRRLLKRRTDARARLDNALRVGIAALGLLLAVVALVRLVSLSARYDRRMDGLVRASRQIAAIQAEHPYEAAYALADRSAFAERLVYWRVGFAGFERRPILGVGLGNAGFLFADHLPTYGYRLVEIRDILDPESPNFPNPKSLWVRLLAETGLAGTAAFVVWLVALAAAWIAVVNRGRGADKALAVAGALALIAQITEGLSLDTFALPQVWIIFGLLTAAARRARIGELEGSEGKVVEA